MNTTANLTPGLIFAATGAIAFSSKAIIVKLAYRWGVDAVTLLMLRMLMALPMFLAMAWWAGRGKPALAPRDMLAVAGLGFCGYYLSSYLDFEGLRYITASLERLIFYITPTLVLVLARLLHGTRWRREQVLGTALSYCGVLLVFGRDASLEGENVGLGAALVFTSCITYSVYLVFSSEIVKRVGALRLVGQATSVACFCCILQFVLLRPLDTVAQLPAAVLWLSLLNATLGTALPVLLVMLAIERIGPGLTAQVGMIGPLSTIALSVLLLDESFTAWLAVGTAMVIIGIYVFSRGSNNLSLRSHGSKSH